MADIEISVPSTQVEKNRLFTKILYKNNGNTYELNRAVIKSGSSSFTWNKEASFKLVANIPGTTNPWGSSIYGFYGESIYYSTTPGLSIGSRSATLNVPQITSDNEDYGYYEWNYNWDGSSVSSGSTITNPSTPITLKLNGSEDLRYYTVSVSVANGLYLGDSSSTTSVSVSNISAYGSLVTTNASSSETAAVACVDNNQIKILANVNRLPDSTPNAFGFTEWDIGAINKELGEFKQSSSYISAKAKSGIVWTQVSSSLYYLHSSDGSPTSDNKYTVSTEASTSSTSAVLFTKGSSYTAVFTIPATKAISYGSRFYVNMGPGTSGINKTYNGEQSDTTAKDGYYKVTNATKSLAGITFTVEFTMKATLVRYFRINGIWQSPAGT